MNHTEILPEDNENISDGVIVGSAPSITHYSTLNVTNVNYTDNDNGFQCNAAGNASDVTYLTGEHNYICIHSTGTCIYTMITIIMYDYQVMINYNDYDAHTHTHTQVHVHAHRLRHTYKQTDRQTDAHTHTHTHTHTHKHTINYCIAYLHCFVYLYSFDSSHTNDSKVSYITASW